MYGQCLASGSGWLREPRPVAPPSEPAIPAVMKILPAPDDNGTSRAELGYLLSVRR